jgi:hypothetical protein
MANGPLNIRHALIPVIRSMAWNRAFQTASWFLLGAASLDVVLLVASKFAIFSPWLVPGTFAAGVLATAAAAAIQVARRIPLPVAARIADRQLELKERLATVCELDALGVHSEMAEILRQDTAEHLKGRPLNALVPLALPRFARWIPLILAAALVALFLPSFHSQRQLREEVSRQAIKATGERIQLISRRIVENPQRLTYPQAAEDLKRIDELARTLSGGQVEKTAALRELTKMTDELKTREREIQEREKVKPLDREAWRDRESFTPENMQALQKQIDALQQKLDANATSARKLSRMERTLKNARDALPNMQPGSEEAQNLSRTLEGALQEAQNARLSDVAEELKKAIEAMQKAEVGQAVRDLDDAIMDLGKAQQQMANLQNLMKQASKAGKDLAEQLERGQTQLAQQTLQNLKRRVDQAQLTPEQKQQLLNELSKALGPSRDYGQLPSALQKAVEHAQQNNQAELSKDLQKAMQELDKASNCQGQQQQLADMINQIEQAGMMISSDSQCDSQLSAFGSRPGAGESGKGGGGVGTWPDEEGGMPEYSATWDNTGVERPDMNPRGQTNRGPATPPGDTRTLKVKGQLGTGGPMPGISLRGLSIKGESNVKVEEAFGAASQEAENALTKESVPKSYQGAVKEYFDLK